MVDNVVLLMWSYFIIAVILIVVVLCLIQKSRLNKYKKQIEMLEREKKLITSVPVLNELSKIEAIMRNDRLEEKHQEWHQRFEDIKTKKIAKISDMILDLDYLFDQHDYMGLTYNIPKIEIEIYKIKTKAELLLGEIKEITLSEEKYRNIITKHKATYRDLIIRFNNDKASYDIVRKSIELQLENIDKRFQEFEKYMENNDYDEVAHIVKALDEMINNMVVVIEEVPNILLLSKILIPKKINDVLTTYKKMLRDDYQLDYLNIDYNITQINEKINNISDKTKVLNVEDSLFELKTMIDYLDSLFNDFDNEKMSKNILEENIALFTKKLNRVDEVVGDIYNQLDNLRYSYDLSDEEIKDLDTINNNLKAITLDFNVLLENKQNKISAYSKLNKELDQLLIRLSSSEVSLDDKLESIGSMHEDEIRAREQLEDLKELLNKATVKIRSYKLPHIPNKYYIELKEASGAIKEIIKELSKKPIAIKILNIRVDTARDLVLKLYTTTNEMVKTAMLSEMAIIYGNRYRSLKNQVDQGLNNAEVSFNKGKYKMALETAINTIDLVEPGIYQRLLSIYDNEQN
ncbi:MAG: septation ring formation regulator EzrA [Bacilli bacterium]